MRHAKTNPPLLRVYHALYKAWGPQRWWPARTRFEVMVGAILTQNTSWTNVEKAIANLRRKRVLNPKAIHAMSRRHLAELIRPAGTFNVKASRLKNYVDWYVRTFQGKPDRMNRVDTPVLRTMLLSVNGVGKETADSILLYAFQRPVFVVDAYTRRFLLRHRWLTPKATYDDVAALFDRNLSVRSYRTKTLIFNEYHALIVALANSIAGSSRIVHHVR